MREVRLISLSYLVFNFRQVRLGHEGSYVGEVIEGKQLIRMLVQDLLV